MIAFAVSIHLRCKSRNLTCCVAHSDAFEQGVLHRDISVGNILIVEEPEDGSFVGFIHDFDYSAMTDVAPGDEEPAPSDAAESDGLGTGVHAKNDERRERTVSDS